MPGASRGCCCTLLLATLLWLHNLKPDSLVCSARSPCRPSGPLGGFVSSTSDVLGLELLTTGSLRERFTEKNASGGRPVALHVGPGSFDSKNAFHETFLYYEVRGSGLTYQVLFVEPNVQIPLEEHYFFKHVMASHPDWLPTMIHFARAAVCTSDGLASFYSPGTQLYEQDVLRERDRELAMKALMSFSSLNQSYTSDAIVAECRHFDFSDRCEALPSYVNESQVLCLKPASLFQAAGFTPDALDVLIVDAQSLTVDVMKLFLALDGLQPVYIKFPHTMAAFEDVAAVASTLASRGYDVHQVDDDVRAVLRKTVWRFKHHGPAM